MGALLPGPWKHRPTILDQHQDEISELWGFLLQALEQIQQNERELDDLREFVISKLYED